MKYGLIIANWKLNHTKQTITNFLKQLKHTNTSTTNINIAIAPPLVYLQFTKNHLIPSISLAAQNVDIHISGPFTGETSIIMLKDIGVKYVLIGHSERRIYHKETDQNIAQKFDIIKQNDLIPVLCIGENYDEHNAQKTQFVCAKQLDTIFKLFGPQAFKNTVIAYEPIWSIGTGITDTPNNIQTTHKFIRDYISSYDKQISKNISIQYGGSVNHTNINKILNKPDVDGVLIGTASLNISNFSQIIHHAEKIYQTKHITYK